MARAKKAEIKLSEEAAAAQEKLSQGLSEVPADGLALLHKGESIVPRDVYDALQGAIPPLDVAGLKATDDQQNDPEVAAYADQLTENDWYESEIAGDDNNKSLQQIANEIQAQGNFIFKLRQEHPVIYDVFDHVDRPVQFGAETEEHLEQYRR